MNQFNTLMTELANAIRAKNPDVTGQLTIQGMIEAVNNIPSNGIEIEYGVIDSYGNFQAIDLSGSVPQDYGDPIEYDRLDMYDTGHDEPDYIN